jgi:hypothetical protein
MDKRINCALLNDMAFLTYILNFALILILFRDPSFQNKERTVELSALTLF